MHVTQKCYQLFNVPQQIHQTAIFTLVHLSRKLKFL